MPSRHIQPRVTFSMIVGDFKTAWDGIASNPNPDVGRGNFLFGLLATLLLEWACRLCHNDSSGELLKRLTYELHRIEPRYLTPLPQDIQIPPPRKSEFALPALEPAGTRPLLWALFDLIRNGQAHQYQQIPARLDEDFHLWISIKGPEQTYDRLTQHRPPDHLAFCTYRDGNVGIRVWPPVFLADVATAIERSGLLDTNIAHRYFERSYKVSRDALLNSLRSGGHHTFPE